MKITINIIQDEDGKDILPTSRLDFEDLSGFPEEMREREMSLRVWKSNAEISLINSSELIPLFQNGALLNVKDHRGTRVLMQIAGIDGSFYKKDTQRCWGTIGDLGGQGGWYSYGIFDVRLFKPGAPC